jgi:hypothetical protein
MKPNNEIEPVEIFSGTIWEAGLVRSLLENLEIETFLRDENTGAMAPWYTAGGGAGAVKVIVSNLDEEKAREIVAEFEKNMRTDQE